MQVSVEIKKADTFEDALAAILIRHNIMRNTHNWSWYEVGKRVIATLDLSPETYERAIRFLTEWVGV